MKFKDHKLAHILLDKLQLGIEIGASAHNPFNLKNCVNVDMSDSMDTVFKKEEIRICGEAAEVNIVSRGDELPFKDKALDFIIHSHVYEHMQDPIKALLEWDRILKPNGFMFMIIPDKYRCGEENIPTTTVHDCVELNGKVHTVLSPDQQWHFTHWTLSAFLDLYWHMVSEYPQWKYSIAEFEEVDSKVGNGFTVILKKVA